MRAPIGWIDGLRAPGTVVGSAATLGSFVGEPHGAPERASSAIVVLGWSRAPLIEVEIAEFAADLLGVESRHASGGAEGARGKALRGELQGVEGAANHR